MRISELKKVIKGRSTDEILNYFLDVYGNKIALASSLGVEDQVLTDIIIAHNKKSRIFIIDTKMLNSETYELIDKSRKHYGIDYEIYSPEETKVSEMITQYGKDLYYKSKELRRKCCHIRKIEPLKIALSTLDVWITGIRKEQSITRTNIEVIEWDEANNLIKLNPLANWTTDRVWDYVNTHKVPYNTLHDEKYPSIGCAPCTRAVKDNEELRAGRWWWESSNQKECGLHFGNKKEEDKSEPTG